MATIPSGSSGLFGLSNGAVSSKTFYKSSNETTGLHGSSSSDTVTYFEWLVFNTSDSLPATPTGGAWNFSTNTGVAPVGWTNSPPSNPTYAVWMSIAVVDSRNPTVLTWSVPGKILSNNQIYVSVTPPANPSINDLWYDLGA